MTRNRRRIGELEVSPIGFGAMVLIGLYGDVSENAAVDVVNAAIDAGVTFVDTADAHGADGLSERLVGRAIAGRRDKVQLATKWGIPLAPTGHEHPRPDTRWANEVMVDARPERARGCLEASLGRLGVDHVDLWYLHWTDPHVPIEDTIGAMSELVAEGKARHLGICNATADELRRAHAVHPMTALQSEWSLWNRAIEAELLGVARELDVGVVPWAPLGSGFLAAPVQELGQHDFRHNNPRFTSENLRANEDRFAPLRDLAGELGCTPAQLAIAWLLAQGDDVVPIPGTRSPERVRENLAAGDVALSDDDLVRIDGIAPPGAAVGASLV